jgi:hypothetical protein
LPQFEVGGLGGTMGGEKYSGYIMAVKCVKDLAIFSKLLCCQIFILEIQSVRLSCSFLSRCSGGGGIDGICASCPIYVAELYHCIIQQLPVKPMCV